MDEEKNMKIVSCRERRKAGAMDEEMMRALEADGEILRSLTGEDHGPYFLGDHVHFRPNQADFEGKTIARFQADADNCWRFWFTDGTALAIQSDLHSGCAVMEVCRDEVCVKIPE